MQETGSKLEIDVPVAPVNKKLVMAPDIIKNSGGSGCFGGGKKRRRL
jgi:hypothetical protein